MAKKSKQADWFGWHFLSKHKKLRYGDGRLVKAGRVYRADVEAKLCKAGMHASAKALDALKYAPGPIVCYVRLRDGLIEGKDKAVARERKVIWMADATTVLHEMVMWVADRALRREREAGREPDPRSWAAIQAKRDWLAGKITDAELNAAWYAARSACDAARYTCDAARSACDAARYTCDAARYACDAAWGVPSGVAWEEHNKELTRRLLTLAPKKK